MDLTKLCKDFIQFFIKPKQNKEAVQKVPIPIDQPRTRPSPNDSPSDSLDLKKESDKKKKPNKPPLIYQSKPSPYPSRPYNSNSPPKTRFHQNKNDTSSRRRNNDDDDLVWDDTFIPDHYDPNPPDNVQINFDPPDTPFKGFGGSKEFGSGSGAGGRYGRSEPRTDDDHHPSSHDNDRGSFFDNLKSLFNNDNNVHPSGGTSHESHHSIFDWGSSPIDNDSGGFGNDDGGGGDTGDGGGGDYKPHRDRFNPTRKRLRL